MRRPEITDDHWGRIPDFLPGPDGGPGGTATDQRLVVNAVLWIAQTGAPGRDPPARFGNWNGEAVRAAGPDGGLAPRRRGVERPRPGVADPGRHRDPGPPARRRGGQNGGADPASGRSRGGFGTPWHSAVAGPGNPVEFVPTGGPEADMTPAEALVGGHEAGAVIAVKAFASEALVRSMEARGAEAVIPPKKNRTCPRG